MNPCISKKIYHSVGVSGNFIILIDIFMLPHLFAVTRSTPVLISMFRTSMEMMVYTRNGTGGLLPYKLWIDPAGGQASTQGKMGEALLPRQEVRISWEAHEPDLRLEDISKRVKKAKEKQVAPAIVTWRGGGSTETKLSSNTSLYSPSQYWACGIEDDLVFNQEWSSCPSCSCLFQCPYLLFKLRHPSADTFALSSSRYPDLCLKYRKLIRFYSNLYLKELCASLCQISYENNGSMHMYRCAKAVVMMMQCLNVLVTQGWETRGPEGEPLDVKCPQHGD